MKKIIFGFCLFILATGTLVAPNTVNAALGSIVYPADGCYSLQARCAPNKELTVYSASTESGANVINFSINSNWHDMPSHQKWNIKRIGSSVWYKIEAENSGKALNVHNGIGSNGTNVSIWPYGGNMHQFKFVDAGNGYYKIIPNVGNGNNFALTVIGNSPCDNANICIMSNNTFNAGPTGQQWKLVRRNPYVRFVYPIDNMGQAGYYQWASPEKKNGYYTGRYHMALDLYSTNYDKTSDNQARTPIKAIGDGTVAYSGWSNANGNAVVIKHDINGSIFYSFYAHLSSCVVSKGTIRKGQTIGYLGKTGNNANKIYHLHFSITDKYKPGSYWGYRSGYISGNKAYDDKGEVLFYNPEYVIKNGKLP